MASSSLASASKAASAAIWADSDEEEAPTEPESIPSTAELLEIAGEDSLGQVRELVLRGRGLRDGSSFSRAETTRRVGAQLDTLADKGVRHAVLSAFGCGAFRNPAREVAATERAQRGPGARALEDGEHRNSAAPAPAPALALRRQPGTLVPELELAPVADALERLRHRPRRLRAGRRHRGKEGRPR